jgi:hypothetical protein
LSADLAAGNPKSPSISFVFSDSAKMFPLPSSYFRSREAVVELEQIGARVIIPQGAHFWADLPIILPEVHSALEKTDGYLILDVGGDEQGSRALGSMVDAIDRGRYQQLMVINSNRPFTSDVAGCVKTMERIAGSARQQFTGLVANSHLVDQTSADDVLAGYNLARQVEKETGLPLVFVSALKAVLDRMDIDSLDCPLLPLTRSLLRPWERREIPKS